MTQGSRRPSGPSPELRALAARLRQMRRDRELSQEALAARAGVHPKHLSEIERANKDPRATTVVRLAEALGVPVAELYCTRDGTDPSAPREPRPDGRAAAIATAPAPAPRAHRGLA